MSAATGQKAQLNALFSAAAAAPAAEAAAIRIVQRPKLGTPPAGLVAAPAGAVATRFKTGTTDDAPGTGRFSGSAVGRR